MTSGDIFQTLISGLTLGGTYALVALGFVIVFSATRVLNFTQGAFLLFGAYLTYQFGAGWGLGFVLAVVLAVTVCALLGVVLERTLMRRFAEADDFQASILTVGLLFIAQALAVAIWGNNPLTLGDPWKLDTVEILGTVVAISEIWAVAILVVAITAVFCYFRFTRGGLAMRACVSDREAAVAQGISPNRVAATAWAMAGAAGAIAGVMLSTGSSGVTSDLILPAFVALPAMVLGGMTSAPGAVVGGLVVGLVQQFTALLQPFYFPVLGVGFAAFTPYLILVAVLALRPQGLFGTRAVERF